MIADFLEHLKWEVRVNRAEHTRLRCKVNDELADSTAPYTKRWNSSGLMISHVMHADNDPKGKRAAEIFHRLMAARAEKYLEALERLQPLFDEALTCVRKTRLVPGVVQQIWNATEVIQAWEKRHMDDEDARLIASELNPDRIAELSEMLTEVMQRAPNDVRQRVAERLDSLWAALAEWLLKDHEDVLVESN
jgi:hypothetical protein